MGWIALGRGEAELSGDLGFLQPVETLGKIVGSAAGSVLLGDEESCLSGHVCPGFSYSFKVLGSVIPLTSERERRAVGTGVGPVPLGAGWGGHPPQTCQFPMLRARKSPPHSDAPHGIKDAEQLLPRQKFPGKFRGTYLEKPFPRDKVDPVKNGSSAPMCVFTHIPEVFSARYWFLKPRFFFPFGNKKATKKKGGGFHRFIAAQ